MALPAKLQRCRSYVSTFYVVHTRNGIMFNCMCKLTKGLFSWKGSGF